MIQQTATTQPTTWLGFWVVIIPILIGNIFLVIKELIKTRHFKKRNGSIENMKKTLTKAGKSLEQVEKDVGETKQDIALIKNNFSNHQKICEEVRKNYDKVIETNQTLLIDHLKNGAKK